ncbi:dihydrofolate reductase [Lachnospiraceae bacterium KM106-2]|nr:dihydrofolate reductase [Lachnospiraceae bacterium KM106-2]
MIALIVAYAKNHVIGSKGRIPWRITGEQQRFRELTTGNVVVMGRHSYEEIGHPLPNRTTIVVSSTKNYIGEQLYTVSSLQEAIALAKDQNIYISGGARLYEEALPLVEKMYVTEIDLKVDGDTYFPTFQEDAFNKEIVKRVEGEIPYSYVTYTKRETQDRK